MDLLVRYSEALGGLRPITPGNRCGPSFFANPNTSKNVTHVNVGFSDLIQITFQ